MSTRYLVIDGHSVIFAWPDLRKLHDENRAAARKALIDRLQHLHDTTAWRVTVVLDGKLGTALPSGDRKPTDMVVSYATADQTADSIIERLVGLARAGMSVVYLKSGRGGDEFESLAAAGIAVEAVPGVDATPEYMTPDRSRDLQGA